MRANIGLRGWAAIGIAMALVVALCSGGRPAMASPLDHRFFGSWEGPSTLIAHEDGKVTTLNRSLTLEFRPFEAEGFEIANFNVSERRDAEFPGGRLIMQNNASLAKFVPAGPGRWQSQTPCADPAKHNCAWAKLEGDTLTINSIAIGSEGRFEVQHTSRTLMPDGTMKLMFRRFAEGQILRQVDAVLTRKPG